MQHSIYFVVAESRLIPSEAKAPQPDHDVRGGDPNSGWPHIIILPREGVQDWPRYIVQKSEALQRLTTPSYLRPAALLGIASKPDGGAMPHLAAVSPM